MPEVLLDDVAVVEQVEGRQAVAELYRPYGATFSLDRCYDLAVHHDQSTGVVVLEYASQGRAIPTGNAYRNRYIDRRGEVETIRGRIPSIEHVVVVRRTKTDVAFTDGRDLWYHDLMADASDDCPPEAMDANARPRPIQSRRE